MFNTFSDYTGIALNSETLHRSKVSNRLSHIKWAAN